MYSVEKDIQFLESVLGKPLPEIDSIYFEWGKKMGKKRSKTDYHTLFFVKTFYSRRNENGHLLTCYTIRSSGKT